MTGGVIKHGADQQRADPRVVRRDEFSAWVDCRFVPGVVLNVLAGPDCDPLTESRLLAASETKPTRTFFWRREEDIGRIKAVHSADCLAGPDSCRLVF